MAATSSEASAVPVRSGCGAAKAPAAATSSSGSTASRAGVAAQAGPDVAPLEPLDAASRKARKARATPARPSVKLQLGQPEIVGQVGAEDQRAAPASAGRRPNRVLSQARALFGAGSTAGVLAARSRRASFWGRAMVEKAEP